MAQQAKPSVKFIAKKMAQHGILQGPRVGRSGAESIQWKRYQKVLSRANEEDLVWMTEDTSAVVQGYGYFGLIEKHPNSFMSQMEKHKDDSKQLFYQYGCVVRISNVIQFVIFEALSKAEQYDNRFTSAQKR